LKVNRQQKNDCGVHSLLVATKKVSFFDQILLELKYILKTIFELKKGSNI